jgi:hypothetical protein
MSLSGRLVSFPEYRHYLQEAKYPILETSRMPISRPRPPSTIRGSWISVPSLNFSNAKTSGGWTRRLQMIIWATIGKNVPPAVKVFSVVTAVGFRVALGEATTTIAHIFAGCALGGYHHRYSRFQNFLRWQDQQSRRCGRDDENY